MTPTPNEPLAAEPGRAAEARAKTRPKRGQLGGGMDDAFPRHPGRLRWPCRRRTGRRSSWWGEIRDAAANGGTSGKGGSATADEHGSGAPSLLLGGDWGNEKQTP